MSSPVVHFRQQKLASGVEVFYREAGERGHKPTFLLLHGFPTSSHMFRHLIPLLSHKYHIIAPDMPGFGHTVVPPSYVYTFDHLAQTIGEFVDALALSKYALYIFDYGAPVGLRLALAHPERVTALVSQNGNAYEEGLGDAWAPVRTLWKADTPDNRAALHFICQRPGLNFQYLTGK
jgi:pimeloyl-ACP methyl ester carboxylesterase